MSSLSGVKRSVVNIALILVGSFLAAFSLVVLLNPAQMAPGGIGAISAMLSSVLPLSIGVIFLILNIPLFLMGLKMDREFFVKSLIGAVGYSLFADVALLIPVPEYDHVLHSVFGGAVMGFGFGLVLYAGGSSGGTDILGWMLHKKAPRIKIGMGILIFDLTIITAQAIIYKSIESAMYAALALFIASRIIDLVVEGSAERCKSAYIISDEYEIIASEIMQQLGRGVTAINAGGMYTGREKKVLLCILSNKQLPRLKRIVADIDSDAFLFFNDAREVFGEGFSGMVNH